MTTRLKVILEKEADGGYSAYVPALPGCASQGDTESEALANIREAAELYVESLKDDGLPVPKDHGISIKEVEFTA